MKEKKNIKSRRVRIGIDVGGTFTKAVAINVSDGTILSKSIVPTTHDDPAGVSKGIVQALSNLLNSSDIQKDEIELISHSTTQAINALLESDTAKVGIVAMGVEPEKNNIIKRTKLSDSSSLSSSSTGGKDLKLSHVFLDTSHIISKEETEYVISQLTSEGAEVVVATEAFGVDEPSNELFVMRTASDKNMPATASHEISGVYGLEIRTLTAAINASVMPKAIEVCSFVERAIREESIDAPLMIMKGDGGVTDIETFRSKPILTVLSGPAASVAGCLVYLKVTNGIFVEVGGTSTNICIIRNGKPEVKYVTINDHPTCIRSMDVRVLGVAGGSMIQMKNNRVWKVGPRSAHIAGLKYSCFAKPEDLDGGRVVMIKPKENDVESYVAIERDGKRYAVTNTCAANALGMVEEEDYAHGNPQSAKKALQILANEMGVSLYEAAISVIQTSSFEVTKKINEILRQFKLEKTSTMLIGGGGGASVLVPFTAKQLGMKYKKADYADVISSIGVASSMIQEELEQTVKEPSPEEISQIHKKVHSMVVSKGAVPESVVINSEFIPEKSILRVTAIGNVEYDSALSSKSVFTLDQAHDRASSMMALSKDLIELSFETDSYFVFTGHREKRKLFGRKRQHYILVIDRYGRMKLSVSDGRMFHGGSLSVLEDFMEFMNSGNKADVSPQVYLLTEMKLVDFSSMVAKTKIIEAINKELKNSTKAAVIVDLTSKK